MFELDLSQLEGWIGQFLWPFARISGFMMAAPVIGANVVFFRVRLLLAVFTTLIVAPNLSGLPAFTGLSANTLLLIAQQILIGILLGFLFHVFFHIFIIAGQIIAMNMGLGFASMVDPINGISVAIVSQFYLIAVTLMFVMTNGHLVMIEVMVESFHTIPIGTTGLSSAHYWQLLNSGTWMFASALLMALPAVATLLTVNFSFGIMSRAAPQLNIFALGFPFSLLVGLTTIWLTSETILPQYNVLAEHVFSNMRQLIQP